MPGQSIQNEIRKIAESIKTLENLRGKIPDDQLETALYGYKKQLQILVTKMRAGAVDDEDEDLDATTSRRRIITGGAGEAFQIYESTGKDLELSKEDFNRVLEHYLRWIESNSNSIRLYGLESLSPEASQLASSMKDGFIPMFFHELEGNLQKEIEQRAADRYEKADRIRTYTQLVNEQINRDEPVLLPSLLTHHERIMLIGPPGSGKSTLLSYLSYNLASNILTGRLLPFAIPDEKQVLIPIIIPIRKYWQYLQEYEEKMASLADMLEEAEDQLEEESKPGSEAEEYTKTYDDDEIIPEKPAAVPAAAAEADENAAPTTVETAADDAEHIEDEEEEEEDKIPQLAMMIEGTLAGFVISYLKSCSPDLKQSKDFFLRLLKGGGCLLMLDGLDESWTESQRMQIKDDLEELNNEIFPGNLIIATCREVGVKEDAMIGRSYARLYIPAVNERQINSLVSNWCRRIKPRQATMLIEAITSEIEKINNLNSSGGRALFSTPLMVDLMICIRLVSTEWPLKRTKLIETLVKVITQTQCQKAQAEGETGWGGNWEDLLNWLSIIAFRMHKHGEDSRAITFEQIENFLTEHLELPMIVQFVRAVRGSGILFQECGEVYMFMHHNIQEFMAANHVVMKKKEIFEQLEYEVSNPWWRSVLIVAYNLAQNEFPGFAQEFMDWLIDLHLPGLELAGSFILELEPPPAKLRSDIAKRLSNALEDKALGALPIHRAYAGRTLAKLGDPRFQEDFWYLPNDTMLGFQKIPGGKYLIGSNPETNREVSSKEVPMHELGMYTYYIARYPVTVAQFRAFIREAKYNPASRKCLQGFHNHPVVNITWDDALAYCRWLKWRLRNWDGTPDEIRELIDTDDWQLELPNEPEWECASHGPRSRPYPWGQKFEPKFANSQEAEIGTTTAVGIFPGGESPYHILDMSGNVWEWTRSIYRIYYYNSADGREDYDSRDFRVLRGGSFLNRRFYARCAYRNMYYRDFLAENIGFRIGLHQSHEYEEREVEMDVPVEEVDDPELIKTADEEGMVKIKRKVMIRKRVITAGPKMDR